jgi:hypothetical protein
VSHDNTRQIARAFRATIESTPLEFRLSLMQSFPVQACGVSSALLGAYFEENDVLGFQWISGVRGTPDPERWRRFYPAYFRHYNLGSTGSLSNARIPNTHS